MKRQKIYDALFRCANEVFPQLPQGWVMGELLQDVFQNVRCLGPSHENGNAHHHVTEGKLITAAGGAAMTARSIALWHAPVALLTCVGKGERSVDRLLRRLDKSGVDVSHTFYSGQLVTPLKYRDINVATKQVCYLKDSDRYVPSVPSETARYLADQCHRLNSPYGVLSDYGYHPEERPEGGIFTAEMFDLLTDLAKDQDVKLFVDARKRSLEFYTKHMRRAHFFTPNRFEAAAILKWGGKIPANVADDTKAGKELIRELPNVNILLKAAEDGSTLFECAPAQYEESRLVGQVQQIYTIPAYNKKVTSGLGGGDVHLGTLVVWTMAGLSKRFSAYMGSVAAGLALQKMYGQLPTREECISAAATTLLRERLTDDDMVLLGLEDSDFVSEEDQPTLAMSRADIADLISDTSQKNE